MSFRPARSRFIPIWLALAVFGAAGLGAGGALAQSAEPGPQRITDREKGESTAKKIARFPIRLVLLPLWILDRGLEHGLLAVDEKHLIPRSQYYHQQLLDKGVQIKIGGATDGAGTGGGIGWTMSDGPIKPTIATGATFRGYQDHSFRLNFTDAFDHKLDAGAHVRYESRPQEDFFGVGPDTDEAERSNYHLEQTTVALQLGKSLSRSFRVDGSIGYEKSNVFDGKDAEFPSTNDVFAPEEVPGLGEGAELVSGFLSVRFDRRNYPGNPTSGGLLHGYVGLFEDVEGENDTGHWIWGGEAQGFVPLLGRGNRFGPRSALGARIRGEFVEDLDTGTVPFYLMPSLGGSDNLRGFRSKRFRDKNSIVLNVEYRWQIQAFLQAVLFLDEGMVAPSLDDFKWKDLESSWGGGLRGVFRNDLFFRFEVGTSVEGTRVFFKFGQIFQVV